jgi:hypothetical protein
MSCVTLITAARCALALVVAHGRGLIAKGSEDILMVSAIFLERRQRILVRYFEITGAGPTVCQRAVFRFEQ